MCLDALQILDANAVQYMIEIQQEEIKRPREEQPLVDEQHNRLEEQHNQLEERDRQLNEKEEEIVRLKEPLCAKGKLSSARGCIYFLILSHIIQRTA